jgi:hypothetical protein
MLDPCLATSIRSVIPNPPAAGRRSLRSEESLLGRPPEVFLAALGMTELEKCLARFPCCTSILRT